MNWPAAKLMTITYDCGHVVNVTLTDGAGSYSLFCTDPSHFVTVAQVVKDGS